MPFFLSIELMIIWPGNGIHNCNSSWWSNTHFYEFEFLNLTSTAQTAGAMHSWFKLNIATGIWEHELTDEGTPEQWSEGVMTEVVVFCEWKNEVTEIISATVTTRATSITWNKEVVQFDIAAFWHEVLSSRQRNHFFLNGFFLESVWMTERCLQQGSQPGRKLFSWVMLSVLIHVYLYSLPPFAQIIFRLWCCFSLRVVRLKQSWKDTAD